MWTGSRAISVHDGRFHVAEPSTAGAPRATWTTGPPDVDGIPRDFRPRRARLTRRGIEDGSRALRATGPRLQFPPWERCESPRSRFGNGNSAENHSLGGNRANAAVPRKGTPGSAVRSPGSAARSPGSCAPDRTRPAESFASLSVTAAGTLRTGWERST